MTTASRWVVAVIVGYQRRVSPWLPVACRFAPTCSEFARIAVTQHGVLRGLALTIGRLGRCHPFHAGGYDPPPPVTDRVA